jgi:hypothetical protein
VELLHLPRVELVAVHEPLEQELRRRAREERDLLAVEIVGLLHGRLDDCSQRGRHLAELGEDADR